MVKEADQYAEADKKKKEEAEIRNQADSLIYTSEKTKVDLKDKIPQDLLSKIDAAVKELKDALAANAEIESIKQKSEALSNVLKEVGTVAYQQAAAASASSSTASGSQPSSDASAQAGGQKVVDAEYKVDSEGDSKS